jgi:6-phospho-beta-glucosidase
MRLVVIGGSGSSTPELVDALEAWPGGLERRPPLAVVLVGRSAAKLEVVAAECRARIRLPGPPITIETQTDRRRALGGADVVVDQVRVGGLAARAFDESFPVAFGIPGEETTGPGGFANALRTVPAQRATWEDIAAVAPGATVVDLTNPAGIVQQAAEREWSLRIHEVCDAPVTFTRAIAARLGRPVGRVVRRYVGTNHCGWYVPESPDELDVLADVVVGMDPAIVRLHGAVPAPYVRYYVNPDRIVDGQRDRETRAQALQRIDAELLAGYEEAPGSVATRRGALWYSLAVLPFVDALLHGSDEPMVVGVRNDGRIAGVPDSTTVEVPHVVSRPGQLVALSPPPLPALPALLLAQVGAYEALTVDACVPGAPPEARLRALLANPLVRDADRAAALLAAIDAGSPLA